jgi:hypothetical protein
MLKYLNGINNNTNMRNTRMQQARRLQILNRSYGVYPTTMEELNGIGKAKGKVKAKVQAKVQKAKAVVKKVAQSKVVKQVAKVGLAPARGAFLALVRVNGLGIAKKLVQAYKINPAKIDNFWKGLSGNPAELRKVVEQGSKQKISGLGVALETIIATATPIVVKLTSLLKSLGIQDPKGLIVKGAKAGIKKLAQGKQKGVSVEEKEVPEEQAEETQVSVEKTIPTPSEVPTTEETNNREVETASTSSRTANPLPLETTQERSVKDTTDTTTTTTTTKGGGMNKYMIPLLIAGAGVGAWLLLGKRNKNK